MLRPQRRLVLLPELLRLGLRLGERGAKILDGLLRRVQLAAHLLHLLAERRVRGSLQLQQAVELLNLRLRIRLLRGELALQRRKLVPKVLLLRPHQLELLLERRHLLRLLVGVVQRSLEILLRALEAHQLAVRLLEFRLELGDGCRVLIVGVVRLRSQSLRVRLARLALILQILLHLRLLFLEKGDARRHRGQLGGDLHDARLEFVSLAGPRLLRLLRGVRRTRNLRLGSLLELGDLRLELRLLQFRGVQHRGDAVVLLGHLALELLLLVLQLDLEGANSLAVLRQLRGGSLGGGGGVRLARFLLGEELRLHLRLGGVGDGLGGDGVVRELVLLGAAGFLLRREQVLEPARLLVELLQRLLRSLASRNLLDFLALGGLLVQQGLLQVALLLVEVLLRRRHRLLVVQLVLRARLLLRLERRVELRLRRRSRNLRGGELVVELLELLEAQLLLRAEQLLQGVLLLLDRGDDGGVRRYLGLHLLRLGLELVPQILHLLLELLEFALLLLHEILQSLRLRRSLGVLRLASRALLLERLLELGAFRLERVPLGGDVLVGSRLIAPSFVALLLELRVELLNLLLESLERGGGGLGGAIVLRLLHLARVLLRGEVRLETGQLVGERVRALLRGGPTEGTGGDILAVALLLRRERGFGVVASLGHGGKRVGVRLLVGLDVLGVLLHQAEHLHAVRLSQRLLHLGLAELRLADDHGAHRLLVLRLDAQRLLLLALERRLEELHLLLELSDLAVAVAELRLEIRVGGFHASLELLHRRERLVASRLESRDLAHLLRGAIQLGLLELGDRASELLHLARAARLARGGGGEAHAKDAVLHARLLRSRLLLVAIRAHGVQLRAKILDGLRVGLHGGGEGAFGLAKSRGGLLGNLERVEGALHVRLEVSLLLALPLRIPLERLAKLLLLGNLTERLFQALLEGLGPGFPLVRVLARRRELLRQLLGLLLHLQSERLELLLGGFALELLGGVLLHGLRKVFERLSETLLDALGLGLPELHILDGGVELTRDGGDLHVLLVDELLERGELSLLFRQPRDGDAQLLLDRLGLGLPHLHLLDGGDELALHGARLRLDHRQSTLHGERLLRLLGELLSEHLSLTLRRLPRLLFLLGHEQRSRLLVRGFVVLSEHRVSLGMLPRTRNGGEELLEVDGQAETGRILGDAEADAAPLRLLGPDIHPAHHRIFLLLHRDRLDVEREAEPERVRRASRQGLIGNRREERLHLAANGALLLAHALLLLLLGRDRRRLRLSFSLGPLPRGCLLPLGRRLLGRPLRLRRRLRVSLFLGSTFRRRRLRLVGGDDGGCLFRGGDFLRGEPVARRLGGGGGLLSLHQQRSLRGGFLSLSLLRSPRGGCGGGSLLAPFLLGGGFLGGRLRALPRRLLLALALALQDLLRLGGDLRAGLGIALLDAEQHRAHAVVLVGVLGLLLRARGAGLLHKGDALALLRVTHLAFLRLGSLGCGDTVWERAGRRGSARMFREKTTPPPTARSVTRPPFRG